MGLRATSLPARKQTSGRTINFFGDSRQVLGKRRHAEKLRTQWQVMYQ